MRFTIIISVLLAFFIIISLTNSQPSFNGTAQGCAGSGCHVSEAGIVTTEVLDNLQVRVTVSGTTAKVGGELVDAGGNVVAVINSSSNNPFILTATSAGTYTVNAGFKNPSLKYGTAAVVINISGIDEKFIGTNPDRFQLYSNYPNPFNPTTKIRYSIKETAHTSLKVYDITGTEIMTLVNEERPAGIYEVELDADNLASGTYIYKLQSGNFSQTKKMILIR